MKSNITKISLKPGSQISIHSKKAIDLFCKRHKLAPLRNEILFSLAGEELERVRTIEAVLRTSPNFSGVTRERHLKYLGELIRYLEGVVNTVPEMGEREGLVSKVEKLGGKLEQTRGPEEVETMKPPEKE